jgi:succinoglycan biosynthesis transport protein ExoP
VNLAQYVAVLRRHWLFILGCTVAAVAVAVGIAWHQTPMYTATSKLFVSTSGGNNASQLNAANQFGQERVKSYTDIVSSPAVLSAVRQQLGLSDSVSALQAEVSASAPLDTVIIQPQVTDASPVRAQRIANAVSVEFTKLVNRLETPQGSSTSPVKVSVVQPAELPATPSSPNKKLDVVLGLLVGLAIGLGGAVLRESLDRTVRTKEAAQNAADAPVIGSIGEDDQAKTRPLIVKDDSFSPRSEAFRQLRTNIRFLSVDAQVRSLVVTGSVANEGKTTTASNLAVALAQAGERVVLVDADLRRPSIAELLGLNPALGLSNVLLDHTLLPRALQSWGNELPLRVITSGPIPPNPSELLGSGRMAELINQLKMNSDVIVFDSPPILPVTDAAALARLTDGAVVVCRAGSTRIEQLRHSADALRRVGAPVLGVVLNRVSKRGRGAEYGGYSYDYKGYRPTSTPSSETAPGSFTKSATDTNPATSDSGTTV